MLALRRVTPRPTVPIRRVAPRRPQPPWSSTAGEVRVWLDTGVLTVGSAWVPSTGFGFSDPAEAVNRVFVFPRGTLWVHPAAGRPFLADVTTLVCHRDGQRYRTPDEAVRVDWFAIAPEVLRQLLPGQGAGRDGRPVPGGLLCSSLDYLRQRLALLQASGLRGLNPLADEELLLRLVAGIAERSAATCSPGCPASGVEKVTRTRLLLGSRYSDRASLAEIGGAVASSTFHLSRTFKGATGLTVHRYLTELRLRASLERIAAPGCHLASVAVDLGFASHSHFTAAFRASFGSTPSEFRRLAEERSSARLLAPA